MNLSTNSINRILNVNHDANIVVFDTRVEDDALGFSDRLGNYHPDVDGLGDFELGGSVAVAVGRYCQPELGGAGGQALKVRQQILHNLGCHLDSRHLLDPSRGRNILR